jgi:hypothetical protein
MNRLFSRPSEKRIVRIASRKGRLSMSPHGPAHLDDAELGVRLLREGADARPDLVVMWGTTCTVCERYSPRRSFWMTERYTCPVVMLWPRPSSTSRKRS